MVIIETPIFTKRIQELIPDEEYRLLQLHLVNRPDAGKIIQGSGGLPVVTEREGVSGSSTIWLLPRDAILLLYAYPKSEQDDLTAEQLRQIRKVAEREYV